jgi:hypothetical protein
MKDKIANNWIEEENKYFENQSNSEDVFQLELTGNKRTGDQIEDWKSPAVIKMEQRLNDWDGKSHLDFEIPEGGEVRKFEELLVNENVPIELPEIGQMKLYQSSKVTDFIKGSFLEQYGFIVSGKAKVILEKFNLGKCKYYPLELIHKEQVYSNYWFLRSSASIKDYIDFEKSSFYIPKGLLDFSSREKITIKSREELRDYRSKIQGQNIYIKASEINLSQNFPNYDLFTSNGYGVQGAYISAKLKPEIIKLTGIEIKPTNRIKKTY